MSLKLCCTFIAGLVFSIGAQAKIYQWVDEQGVAHFSNRPPPGMAVERQQDDSATDEQVETTNDVHSEVELPARVETPPRLKPPFRTLILVTMHWNCGPC